MSSLQGLCLPADGGGGDAAAHAAVPPAIPVDKLVITAPDDLHHHFRDGDRLVSLMNIDRPFIFSRAIAMPNLKPPVTTADQAMAYKKRIVGALPDGLAMEPLMTLYLTDKTTPEEIMKAKAAGVVALKLYPAGATTNSDSGVTDIFSEKLRPTLKAMEDQGLLLLVHGEVTEAIAPGTDVFDKEAVFVRDYMERLVKMYPTLRIVQEHITTKESVEFVKSCGPNVAATITAHHLLYNRNEIFKGGIRPHYYCLPILKREAHRLALLEAIKSGSPKFFLGTDSAAHHRYRKETSCGCAGCYTACCAMELYAEVFDKAGCLDKLEAFSSFHGADFYGLPRNKGKIELVRAPWKVPAQYKFGDDTVVPIRAGENVEWSARRL